MIEGGVPRTAVWQDIKGNTRIRIGESAKLSGIGERTLRFYHETRLLPLAVALRCDIGTTVLSIYQKLHRPSWCLV
jgi:hypothetical protein